MRLLKCDAEGVFSLTEDIKDAERPKYAILSHTWSTAGPEDEVTYEDIVKGTGLSKSGREKLLFCARQSKLDRIDHFWVDTCCIDKRSAAELSKSLISMFRWYSEAEKCYVYLSDVSHTDTEQGAHGNAEWEQGFRKSRWFSRGWTLQELLAPRDVKFFSRDGTILGTKASLEAIIAEMTHIPVQALRGKALKEFSVHERMVWQEDRETSEPEDLVYSLLGVFGVSMPVLYGEGREQARERLLRALEHNNEGNSSTNFSVTFSLSEAVETPHFVARRSELRDMHGKLRSDGRRRYVVLHGLGGIGKTQLAISYAVQHQNDYSAIFWLNAKDEVSIKSSFAHVAKQILREHDFAQLRGLDLQRETSEAVEGTKAWLSLPTNTRWLLICDNYDNPALPGGADSTAIDLLSFLPESYQGAVIITTRSSQVQLGQSINITKMEDSKDSLAILQNASKRENVATDQGAVQLACKLDGLPLALATAGAYLSQSSMSFAKYLEIFERSWAKLQRSSPTLLAYDRTLFSTWQISFEQVERKSLLSAQLLRWWAYFDNEDLWYELLNHPAEDEPQWMQDIVEDELDFNNAMQILHAHGFVQTAKDLGVESPGYSIHPCVHSWLKAVLNEHYDNALAASAFRRVAHHAPGSNLTVARLLERRLLSHAKYTLSYLDKQPGDSINLAAQCYNLGLLYKHQSKLAEAEKILLRALSGYESIRGSDHIDTLDASNELGFVYSRQDRFFEAHELYQRALKGYEQKVGPSDPATLNIVHNLGFLCFKQGNLVEAYELLQRALQGYEAASKPDHQATFLVMNNLGWVCMHQDKMQEAEVLLHRALKGFEELLGAHHNITLHHVARLGHLLAAQWKSAQAIEMYERTLHGYKTIWGPDHVATLEIMIALGFLYTKEWRFTEAETMLLHGLRGTEMELGPGHKLTLYAVDNLGVLYASQGRLTEAEAMYQRALRGRAMTDGVNKRAIYVTYDNLGRLYNKQGKMKEAEAMFLQALDGREKTWGMEHSTTLDTVLPLGILYREQGRMEEAEKMLLRALRGFEATFDSENSSIEYSLRQLLILYQMQSVQGSLNGGDGDLDSAMSTLQVKCLQTEMRQKLSTLQPTLNTTPKTWLYTIGRILLSIDDEANAIFALQHHKSLTGLVECDKCERLLPADECHYICRTCDGIDFCISCWSEDDLDALRNITDMTRCKHANFFTVPAMDAVTAANSDEQKIASWLGTWLVQDQQPSLEVKSTDG